MAWYKVHFEVKVPVIRFDYLIEVDGDISEDGELKARMIAMEKFGNYERPEPKFEFDEERGQFIVVPEDNPEHAFDGLNPTDPEFKRTIYGEHFLIPAE